MEMTFKRGGKTGYPAGLLQDDDAQLSKWFASKPDARYIVKKNIEERNNDRARANQTATQDAEKPHAIC